MNRKSALIISAFFTAFTLVGTGIVVKSVQTAQTQRNTTVVSTTQSAATLAQTTNTASNTTANALKVAVSSDTAAQTATQTVPGATLLATPELVSFQGAVAYEVSLDAGKVYVDANTGAVLYNTVAQAQAQPNVWQGEREGDEDHDERGESHSRHQAQESSEEDNHEHDN